MKQVFNRRETDKERVFKEAMAFLVSYSVNRKHKKPIEVQYNVARAFHYLGMNTHAQQIYEDIIKQNKSENAMQRDLILRSRFNLAQILKGSGVSLGITVRGINQQDNTPDAGSQKVGA